MEGLSPLERVIVRLHQGGMPLSEIGRRVAKRPGTVERILGLAELRDSFPRTSGSRHELRPVERVVRNLRARGESYGEIGNRLGCSGAHARRIEEYAGYRVNAGG